MTWAHFTNDDAAWDDIISRHSPKSPFQGSAWANFRVADGWQPVRFILENEQAAVQFLTKHKMGLLAVCWSAGGLAGSCSPTHLAELPMAVRNVLGSRVTYLRISDFREFDSEHEVAYLGAGWTTSRHAMSSGRTLVRSLTSDHDQLRVEYSSNWSRNLRRGEQRGIHYERWTTPDYTLMAEMYRDVVDLKKSFSADWRASPESLSDFATSFGDSLCIVRAISPDWKTLSYRAAVNLGSVAFDILAATSYEGRKCYASHVATDGLLETLASLGCTHYDFGGVDQQGNSGVYNFKHGAGGRDFRYLGEWHCSLPQIARRSVEHIIHMTRTSSS